MTAAASVSIVGFAACSSVGYSLESTLAAMGAGLSNFTETDVGDQFGQPALAASLVEGGSRQERLAALSRHALDDAGVIGLVSRATHVPLFAGVPSDLTADERSVLQAVFAERAPLIAGTQWFPYGRASSFAALAAGIDVVANGAHRFALVAGIDSLCTPAQIGSLVQARRLLSPLAEGTIPGEAAAFALLGRSDDPAVDPRTSVRVEAVALKRAQTPFVQARVVSADGLTSVFRHLRAGGAARVHRIVAAHSGEGYFGRSFAYSYLREIELMPEPLDVELIADRVGDIGAASGIVGLAYGMYLMVRHVDQKRPRTLTYSESDTGESGGAIIDGAPTSWRRAVAGQDLS